MKFALSLPNAGPPERLVAIAGAGRVEYIDWPAEKKAIDIGDFYADSSKFRQTTGWIASTELDEGLRTTVDYYRRHFDRYVDASVRAPEHA